MPAILPKLLKLFSRTALGMERNLNFEIEYKSCINTGNESTSLLNKDSFCNHVFHLEIELYFLYECNNSVNDNQTFNTFLTFLFGYLHYFKISFCYQDTAKITMGLNYITPSILLFFIIS